jgi:DNA-binding MarR family transcriptional regulator
MLNDRRQSIFGSRYVQESHAAQAALSLYRIAQGIETMVRRQGASLGLSRLGVQALLFLSNAHPSSRTIGSISRRFSVTPATATRLVDALERKGLAERARLKEDRRSVRVELTEEGQAVITRIVDIGEELKSLVDHLPQRDQQPLSQSLMEILRVMQQADYVTVSGICRTCAFFQPNAYPGEAKPHLCTLTAEGLSEEETYLERVDWAGDYPA